MLINRDVFSLPPYISTSWGHVMALFMREGTLNVVLSDGTMIKIPRLASEVVERIFAAHASYLEEQSGKGLRQQPREGGGVTTFEMPFRLNIGNLEGLATALQHSPEQADMPDLPSEMLEKIGTMAKIAGLSDPEQIPKAEPHCNCAHCQIARAIYKSMTGEGLARAPSEVKTASTSSPLKTGSSLNTGDALEKWIVEQCDEHLYQVINREDADENYKVYLGEGQVGCNCGEHGCDHILAVLRS